jgi:putative transposase
MPTSAIPHRTAAKACRPTAYRRAPAGRHPHADTREPCHTATMPNYRRFHIPGQPVFLTIVTHNRRTWLADDECVDTLLKSMRWAKGKHPFRHLAHVVLPHHLHWMLLAENGTSFSDLVGAVKRDVTWRLKESGHKGPFWQKRFYDHLIRDDTDFGRHLDYIHFNPVKHGYVSRPRDYRWSSFPEWVKRGVYEDNWEAIEPDRIKHMDLE